MKKSRFHKAIILAGIVLSGTLFSCASEGEENQIGSPVYQVDYFDEVGNQIGYAYAIEGKSGAFKSMDGTSYDWNPHSDLEITTPGSRYVFDKWVGTYDSSYGKVKEGVDGQAIDLNHIQGNCKVVATFKEEAYKIETAFKNDNKTYTGGAKVDFGSPLNFPGTNPSEEHPEYYNDYSFAGWTLVKDSSATKHQFLASEHPSYVWKAGAEAGQPSWGLGAPEDVLAAGNEGVLYLDKTLTDHMPEYNTYISDGTKWVELGKLSSNSLKIEFNSAYTKSYKDFTVTLLSEDKTTEVATFTATYADDITYERTVSGTTTTIAVKYAGETKHTYTIDTTNKIAYLLEGEYLNKNSNPNKHSTNLDHAKMSFVLNTNTDGVPVGGTSTLKGNVNIYPLVSNIQ